MVMGGMIGSLRGHLLRLFILPEQRARRMQSGQHEAGTPLDREAEILIPLRSWTSWKTTLSFKPSRQGGASLRPSALRDRMGTDRSRIADRRRSPLAFAPSGGRSSARSSD